MNNETFRAIRQAVAEGIREAYNARYIAACDKDTDDASERATGQRGRITGVSRTSSEKLDAAIAKGPEALVELIAASSVEAEELDALWQQNPDSKHGYPTKWEKLTLD